MLHWKPCQMDRIDVENIRLYAYHGCLEEEARIGTDYRVDVSVWGDLSKAAESDELIDTIDYVHINKVVTEEMRTRAKLLEQVAKRILDRLLAELPQIGKVKVKVSKLMPPINGNVESVGVTLRRKRIA
jgi:dihydroneopterin aldolase